MWTALRKFGLQYCDLPTMLQNVSILLRMLTLNVDSRHTKRAPVLLVLANIILVASYYYVYLFSMAWFVFCRCLATGDVITAMIVFSLGVTSEIAMTKLIFMFIYNQQLKQIMDGYLACDALVEPGSRFSRNLMITLRYVKKRALIFWLVINLNGIVYILKPMIIPGRHLMEDDFILFGLEPMFESPHYEIAFILCTCGVFITCFPSANITAFLIVTAGYTEAQMLALSKELQCLWDDANEHYRSVTRSNLRTAENVGKKSKILNEFVKIKLESVIVRHVQNLVLIRQVESVFRQPIAMEFLLLIIGLISELLGGLENTYIDVPYALMQVSMDCLTGQRLMDASIIFKDSVYDCGWENFDKSNLKTVLLMLQLSQKTMTLSAGGVAMLNFQCLMSVIRSIYSAYTTLRTTMSS